MSIIRRNEWPSLLLAMLTGCLAFMLMGYLHARNIQKNMVDNSQYLLSIVDDISVQVDGTLDKLNSRGVGDCSAAHLLFMRQTQFLTSIVRDIGFYRNGYLVCTTGLGVLEPPVEATKPDYVGRKGAFVYANQELLIFDRKLTAFVIGRKNYSLVLDLQSLSRVKISPFVWEAVHVLKNKTHHLAGKQGLYTTASDTQRAGYLKLAPRYFACSQMLPDYCVVISADSRRYVQSQFQTYLFMVLACVVLAGVVFFWHQRMLNHRRSIRYRIIKGLKTGSFYWLAQPVVALRDEKIKGCEILARFEDKNGPVFPDQFIPVLRSANLSWAFTELMLTTVLDDCSRRDELPDNFRIGFNIFPRDLQNDASIERLLQLPCVVNSRFKIVLEITEDESLDTVAAQANMRRLQKAGIVIAIDDFGTGYSNLNALKNIDCQILKIDRSFVMDMEEKSIRSSLIPHIVEIAHELGLDVIAEGVENSVQKEQLSALGLTHAQGYLFGRPAPVDTLIDLLKHQ